MLLPTEEVNIWLKHLQTVSSNRKKGAQKAVQTRRAKTSQTEALDTDIVYCGKCGEAYEEKTEEIQNWIACDVCNCWFHWICVSHNTGNNDSLECEEHDGSLCQCKERNGCDMVGRDNKSWFHLERVGLSTAQHVNVTEKEKLQKHVVVYNDVYTRLCSVDNIILVHAHK